MPRLMAVLALAGACAWTLVPNAARADDCANATTQFDLNQCAEQDWEAADAELNKVYRKLMDQSGPEDKEGLRKAERDWIKYRDDSCASETSGSEGGSIHPMEESNCMADKTRARIRELKQQLN